MARGKATTPQNRQSPHGPLFRGHTRKPVEKGVRHVAVIRWYSQNQTQLRAGSIFQQAAQCDRRDVKHEVRRMKKTFWPKEGLLFNSPVINELRHEKSFLEPSATSSWNSAPSSVCFVSQRFPEKRWSLLPHGVPF